MSKSKTLVAYFSCGGVTKKVAASLASAAGAELIEIKPDAPYSAKDLDWTDKKSRSTVEMTDPNSRPGFDRSAFDVAKYDAVFVGFPIWWYVAPHIVNSFLESFDFSGKKIIPFATSGGSGLGGTEAALRPSCPGAELLPGKLLNGASDGELSDWVASLKL